jgi:hypothetical protein
VRGVVFQAFAYSARECVDNPDYDDSRDNEYPIGNLNARYRCFSTKPFHGFPSHNARQLAASLLWQLLRSLVGTRAGSAAANGTPHARSAQPTIECGVGSQISK